MDPIAVPSVAVKSVLINSVPNARFTPNTVTGAPVLTVTVAPVVSSAISLMPGTLLCT